MENARILKRNGAYLKTLDGELIELDQAFYDWTLDEKKSVKGIPVCKCCGGRVYTCRERGMAKQESESGFFHFGREANELCPKTFATELRFDPILNNNSFDALEKDRNEKALEEWKENNDNTLILLMRGLTGEEEISEKDRNILEGIERKIICMVGLADCPRALPYMLVGSFIGLRNRTWDSGNKSVVGYAWGGAPQGFPVTDKDGNAKDEYGRKRMLHLPGEFIRLSFGGKRSKPVGSWEGRKFDVSEKTIRNITENTPVRNNQHIMQQMLLSYIQI